MRTERLNLRCWRPEDAEPFARMNGDARVAAFLPARLDRTESDALMGRIRDHFAAHGFGLWVVEVNGGFAGCVGLLKAPEAMPFAPALELAWRLDPAFWGHGYASEAARHSLGVAFNDLGAERVVAYTVPQNAASRRVMERIGLRRDVAGDFDHPALPIGHRLRRHVLYRLSRAEWAETVSRPVAALPNCRGR